MDHTNANAVAVPAAPAPELFPSQQAALERITALRNPEAHYLVYKITGPTGKIYIGYTGGSLAARWRKGGYDNYDFREEMNRYGIENFRKEVLCENLTKEGALHLEYEFIERLHARDPEVGYNSLTGGRIHVNPSPRSNLRQRASLINYYAQHPEVCKRISAKMKRFYENAPELVEICRTRSMKAKPLRCKETGEAFRSLNFAAKQMRISRSTLRLACNDPYATCCGLHWEWVKK